MAAVGDASLLAAPSLRASSFRGAEGFFRVGRTADGQWSFFDPHGHPFYARAVHGVRSPRDSIDVALAPDTAARLRAWGFNSLGVGCDAAAADDGFALMASVDFCEVLPLAPNGGLRLPDVFHPEWPRRAQEHALERCAPASHQRDILGWVTDATIAWAQPSLAGRPSLLQLCLSLEPSFTAYHAAWEFVLALHGGNIESVAHAWGASLANKEVVRELTRAEEGLGTRGYLRDDARWTREFARRYFTSTAAAIRAADPNHLVLGCRFTEVAGPHVLAECAYPAVDIAMPDWRERPAGTESDVSNPVLAGNVNWTTAEFLKRPNTLAPAASARLTSVEWMLRRGRVALERLARHRCVVGYAWRQWQDEPGEQPPFGSGLVHVNGAEAREHTELIAAFNARVEAVRRARPPQSSDTGAATVE
jgi:hypothetical protein